MTDNAAKIHGESLHRAKLEQEIQELQGRAGEVSHQPAPETPVHVAEGQSEHEQSIAREEEEGVEEERKSANRVTASSATGSQ